MYRQGDRVFYTKYPEGIRFYLAKADSVKDTADRFFDWRQPIAVIARSTHRDRTMLLCLNNYKYRKNANLQWGQAFEGNPKTEIFITDGFNPLHLEDIRKLTNRYGAENNYGTEWIDEHLLMPAENRYAKQSLVRLDA